ncbi:MAG: TlpA family protein disulfide reductase [Phycisphaerae bacterium]|nr:TlpA family protein disulfide reductase [Phycisphaerae bacterium]
MRTQEHPNPKTSPGLQAARCCDHVVAAFMVSTLLLAPASATPPPSSEAIEILQKANAAAGQLKAIAYKAKSYAEGGAADKYPRWVGTVVAKRGPTDEEHKVAIEGTVTDPSGEAAWFSVATDGTNGYAIDGRARVFLTGDVKKSDIPLSNPLFPPRYLHDSPFSDEIKNDKAEYLGMEEVAGVACKVVGVKDMGPGIQSVKLFFAKEDYLLRRVEATIQLPTFPGRPAPTGNIIFSVSSLDPNPDIADDSPRFRLECPAGFVKRQLALPDHAGHPALLPIGSQAPDFELKTPKGKTVTLKSLRGKVVLLDFWATWCNPCKMAMPMLQKLHERFQGKPVAVYGVNCMERSRTDPMTYIKQNGYTYGQLLHGDAVASAYKVMGIPCFYVIGPDGKILDAQAGFNPQMEVRAAEIIKQAMKK